MQETIKIRSRRYANIELKVIPGHFVTPNSHINKYIDMTTMKTRQSEATAIAHALSETFVTSTVVDTIICMDGTEVIGAYLAQELTRAGILSQNAHKTVYILTPEHDLSGQMIFRDNMQAMIRDKHVLVLLASTTTGTTVARAIESINYYGGTISGIAAIFSAISKIYGIQVHALFTKTDLPDYKTCKSDACELCKAGIPIDAIANGFGYSKL